MIYKITDEAALKAAYPQFVKTISILDQKAVRYAIKAGIEIPGVEACIKAAKIDQDAIATQFRK